MADVFGHKYELYIRKPLELIQVHQESTGYEGNAVALTSPTSRIVSANRGEAVDTGAEEANRNQSIRSGYSDYLVVDVGSVVIKNPIQMEADIKYNNSGKSGSPQTATIKVYNLSKSTLRQIEKDSAILLKAGYDNDKDLPVIFVGSVEKVSTERNGADTVTTMLCKEGGTVSRTKEVTLKFAKDTLILSMFITVMDEFKKCGIPTGNFFGNAGTLQTIQSPMQFSGNITSVLTELCNMLPAMSKMVWFISRGKLYVQPKYEDRFSDIVKVYPSNVIGSIAPNDSTKAQSASISEERPHGIKTALYLNGDIGLENYVEVTYGDYIGTYKPTSIQYNLNWKNGPWQVVIESDRADTISLNQTVR